MSLAKDGDILNNQWNISGSLIGFLVNSNGESDAAFLLHTPRYRTL